MLETERLIIRNFIPADWEALHEMIVQYASSEFAVYDQPWPTSPEEIKSVAAWFASGESYQAVCLKPSDQEPGRFIGFVALNPLPGEDGPAFNLGYIFNSVFHGKGYATEACRALIGRAFGPLQARRVVSGTAASNRASCCLLERLGFRRVSESTGSLQNTPDGKPIEFLGCAYAISREEWKEYCSPSPSGEGVGGERWVKVKRKI